MIYCHRFMRRQGWLFLGISILWHPSVWGCLFLIMGGNSLCERKCLVILCFFGWSRLFSLIGFGADSLKLLFKIHNLLPNLAIILLCLLVTNELLFLDIFIRSFFDLLESSWNRNQLSLCNPICSKNQALRFYHCQAIVLWNGDRQTSWRDLWGVVVVHTNRRFIVVQVRTWRPNSFRHHSLVDFKGNHFRWETVCICWVWQVKFFVPYYNLISND